MNTTRLACACLLAAGMALQANAAPAMSLVTTSHLQFGRFAAGAGGTVSVAPSGMRTHSGGVVLLSSPATPASFAILGGNPGQVVILTLPSDGSEELKAGPHRMALRQFSSNRPPAGMLNSPGGLIQVGATLQVAPNQHPASYTGKFQITLEYQ